MSTQDSKLDLVTFITTFNEILSKYNTDRLYLDVLLEQKIKSICQEFIEKIVPDQHKNSVLEQLNSVNKL